MNRSALPLLPAALLVGLLGWAGLRAPPAEPVLVVLPGAPADPSGHLDLPPALDNPLDRALASTLTADDVARGVWALAGTTDGPALDAAQRAALRAPVAQAAALRSKVGELRARRRAAVAAEQADWAEAARLLPPAQLAAAPGPQPPGATPRPGGAPGARAPSAPGGPAVAPPPGGGPPGGPPTPAGAPPAVAPPAGAAGAPPPPVGPPTGGAP